MFTRADLLIPVFAAFALLAFAAVAAPLLARRRRAAGFLHFVLVAAAGVLLAAAGLKAALGGGMDEAEVLRLGPIALPILLDGLSGVFLAVIAVLSVMSALYAVRYMDHYPDYGLGDFYAAFPLFILGMAALVTVDDLSLGFTVAWQVMTVASFVLIRFERKKRENVRAAAKYLALMELAWLLVIGAGLLAGGSIGDSLHALAGKIGGLGGGTVFAVYGLLLVGFGMKAGVFPLGQLWLPDAHSVAASPVSALLSGVMLKTGIFGLLRVFFFMVPPGARGYDPGLWGGILAVVGAATLFIGTIQSVKQSDAKRLLAFSSIGQIGYIVLGMGAALFISTSSDPGVRSLAAVAVLGALFHVLNHAAFKGLLFLSSGSLLYATGTKDLNRLGGLIKFMPVSAAVAGIASLSIAGMPPTSGFASKWTIITSSLLAGDRSVVLVLFGIVALFTSAVTLACYVKFFGMAYTASGSEWTVAKAVREVPGLMLAPKLVLAALCVVQGLFPFLFFGLITSAVGHSPGFLLGDAFAPERLGAVFSASLFGIRLRDLFGTGLNAATAPLVVLGLLTIALLAALFLRRSGGSRERTVPTWLCGYQELNAKNRYVDRGMFAAFKNFFRWTGGRTAPRAGRKQGGRP
jgi:formate hydrogenlyase subunit 3/multisubunit Na+/H+ antiporter MnhD subunit